MLNSMTRDEIILAQKEYLFPSVFHYFATPLVISHAKDQYVWDADGKQYLDFFGGIVTISVGHCNEQVNAKVQAQIDRLQHVSTVLANEPQVALARKMAEIAPGRLKKSFFTNSGTEANETAILAARCYTGSSEVIALRYSYHGRSGMGMAMSGLHTWRLGGSAPAGFVFAHNAYCYRCPFGLTYPSCEVRCAKDLDEAIKTTTSGKIAAFIAEPLQGVGGYITPPPEYFKIIENTVRQYGGLFISDEVQTGWGRTGGKWFGIEQWGVEPDILTSAKGLGNGTPIGWTIARPEVADAVKGATISTFGGNPVATTAAKAVIDFIEENNLRINAAEVGAYLRARLEDLKSKHRLIGEVRGMGLMQAMELVRDPVSKEPATTETLAIMEAARERGVLVGKGGLYGNVLRCTPPLNISKTDVDHFVGTLDESFEHCARVQAGAAESPGLSSSRR